LVSEKGGKKRKTTPSGNRAISQKKHFLLLQGGVRVSFLGGVEKKKRGRLFLDPPFPLPGDKGKRYFPATGPRRGKEESYSTREKEKRQLIFRIRRLLFTRKAFSDYSFPFLI